MRSRIMSVALLGAAAAAAALPVSSPAQSVTTTPRAAMVCVAPTDAAGLDAMLQRAGSPLAGEGSTFVAVGVSAGIDPRALVAIAAHETILETYGPAQAIHNPFGLGPGWAFASEADAIARAGQTLAAFYLPEGRDTLAAIGAKWAPLGVANDPAGLNQNWTTGVGSYYAALGGDPSRTVLIADQNSAPGCLGAAIAPTAGAAEPAAGPPVVTAWGGAVPRTQGSGPRHGGDPRTGAPATIPGFVFPLALPESGAAVYRDAFSDPGVAECEGDRYQCAVTIAGTPGSVAVAMVGGTLRAADPGEVEEGIAFWIERADGDRLGYGPLASYPQGIGEGAVVSAGRPLGTMAGWMRIAWERAGRRVNPFPLLEATRPPTG